MKIQTLLDRTLVTVALLLSTSLTQAQSFKIETLAENQGIVWGMDFISDRQMIFTERNGQARLLNIKSGQITQLDGLPKVYARSQGGLLDVKISPDFKQNGWIYFTYSKPHNNSAITTLARAKLSGDTLIEWQDLLISRLSANPTTFLKFGASAIVTRKVWFTTNNAIFCGKSNTAHVAAMKLILSKKAKTTAGLTSLTAKNIGGRLQSVFGKNRA